MVPLYICSIIIDRKGRVLVAWVPPCVSSRWNAVEACARGCSWGGCGGGAAVRGGAMPRPPGGRGTPRPIIIISHTHYSSSSSLPCIFAFVLPSVAGSALFFVGNWLGGYRYPFRVGRELFFKNWSKIPIYYSIIPIIFIYLRKIVLL